MLVFSSKILLPNKVHILSIKAVSLRYRIEKTIVRSIAAHVVIRFSIDGILLARVRHKSL